jgi:glycerol-3-phosphate dehydrogenase
VLPIDEEQRSALLLRIGLLIYDWIGWRRILPGTRELDLITDDAGQPLRRQFHNAFEYSDCFADDSRLVVLNAVDAAERGAVIRPRTRCVRAERTDVWRVVLMARGQRDVVTARILINATGAWAESFAENALRLPAEGKLRLDKGSHIVVRRLYEHDRAYILQTADRRVVFAIPFERDFTLIGTTDQSFSADPSTALPTGDEIDYLCGVINSYFRTTIAAADVVWAYAGVRGLYDDSARKAQDTGREYVLALDDSYGKAPLLTVYGGKITTYRRLAEEALAKLADHLPASANWTARSALPGGDFVYDGIETLVERTLRTWPFLTTNHAWRLTRAFGTRIDNVLKSATKATDLGIRFGADLTAAEVRYLMTKEWAQTADDVLWRRSKLGLHFSDAQRQTLDRFMAQPDG